MSSSQPKQNEVNQTPKPAVPAKDTLKDPEINESALVKLYKDLTGEDESQARNAFMFVIRDDEESSTRHTD